jgi:hypothetical protein
MNMMTLSQGQQPVSGRFRVDVSRGQRIGRVSSEWFARPDDERYLNLPDLYEAVRGRAEHAQARTVESRAIRVEANRDNPERLALTVPRREEPVAPTYWSFGQLCTLVGVPTSYLRQLPAALSVINLQHGLLSHRAELVKTLEADNGCVEPRAVTGPDYGRLWDHELVAAVMKIAGNGTGDTRWKVPGVLTGRPRARDGGAVRAGVPRDRAGQRSQGGDREDPGVQGDGAVLRQGRERRALRAMSSSKLLLFGATCPTCGLLSWSLTMTAAWRCSRIASRSRSPRWERARTCRRRLCRWHKCRFP